MRREPQTLNNMTTTWTRTQCFPDGPAQSKLDRIVYFAQGWDATLLSLKNVADPENWGSKDGILHSYITQLFRCIVGKFLYSEGDNFRYDQGIGFSFDGETFVIHTGLSDTAGDDIYGCFHKKKSSNEKDPIPTPGTTSNKKHRMWNFEDWCTKSTLVRKRFPAPKRFIFFDNFHQLYYNPDIELVCNARHFIEDDASHRRLQNILGIDVSRQLMIERLEGAIQTMKRRASQNFRTVVPQYFHDKNNFTGMGEVQLLLPLLMDDKYLVVAVSKRPSSRLIPDEEPDPYKPDHWCYLGSTILTKAMAYKNARLINRLESEWLTVDGQDEVDIDDESVVSSMPEKGPGVKATIASPASKDTRSAGVKASTTPAPPKANEKKAKDEPCRYYAK